MINGIVGDRVGFIGIVPVEFNLVGFGLYPV